ncbi:MAG: hypothetical protein ACKVYV_06280 [Limisphaerales bacterium]
MKHPHLTGLAALAAAALLAGCGGESSAPEAATAGGATAASTAAKPYPLDVCIVSDEKLGSMGDPVVKVVDGQEVKFCCKSCIPDFEKEQAKFMTKLAAK